MKAQALAAIAALALAGCASTQKAPDWHDYVVPMADGTNKTEVYTIDKSNGQAYALRFARSACSAENGTLAVIDTQADFVGISDNEKAANIAINTASQVIFRESGYWLGQKETPADWRTTMIFRCDS